MKTIKFTANISWEMDVDDKQQDLSLLARKSLSSILPKNFSFSVNRIKGGKTKNTRAILGEFTLEEVFSKLSEKRAEFIVDNQIYLVKMASQRYHVFKDCSTCVSCGLQGIKFLLEKHPNDNSPHLNLYAEEDGNLILFTKDHIKAKAKGGLDEMNNYQVMCSICNNLKAEYPLTVEQVKNLREIWNVSLKNELSKKKVAKLVREVRQSMVDSFKTVQES